MWQKCKHCQDVSEDHGTVVSGGHLADVCYACGGIDSLEPHNKLYDIEMCEDCGALEEDPDQSAEVSVCETCNAIESFKAIEVCHDCFFQWHDFEDLCDDCKQRSL